MSAHARLVGHGHALPAAMAQDRLWDEFFAEHHGRSRVAEAIWRRSGVVTRHGVADPRDDDVSRWSTGARMRRFVKEALPLGKEAVATCLADAGLDAGDVDQLTVASCTGYVTPGLDILLARDLGMPESVQRLHVGHMGCYAAIPALAAAADAAAARGAVGVVACVELTSLHLQPPTADREQIVAHALFSDAAAAVAVVPQDRGGRGLELLGVAARTLSDAAELMTWDVTDLGFRMGLSPRVPRVLSAHVAGAVDELLARHGVRRDRVRHWAVHPGGPRIIDTVAERLGLDEPSVAASRAVLAEHGNCSSATILLILDRLQSHGSLAPGEHVVALAFGPGLTLYAALLRSS